MSQSKYETFSNMKPRISVCTSANVINVQGFIDELSTKFPNFDVQYFELPYNDIDHFTFRPKDVGIMILCHSIDNRRFAITNVMDALYDRFLPYSAKILGKKRLCVLVHDFPTTKKLDDPDKYKQEIEIFQGKQPTTFQSSDLVMMGGKLEGPVELQESNWQELGEFLMTAARSPMPEPEGCCERIMKMLYEHPRQVVAALIIVGVTALVIGLAIGLNGSSPKPDSSIMPTSTATTPTLTPSAPE